ncbi:hypothetical protein D9611_002865 [Ephemerocybe angulata]|uniref:ATP-dependent DNA helicase n=1 Tax=Ephemerocybe angulata TaxID=980116 RepID=A0A8H5C864_9AGAR|nr:hypothetical protein D9611_002865 [Tulosesus angulatus]
MGPRRPKSVDPDTLPVTDEDLDGPKLNLEPPNPVVHRWPPEPLTAHAQADIVRDLCEDLVPLMFEEAGCAICGQLTLLTDLAPLDTLEVSLDPLIEVGLVRKERKKIEERIKFDKGPVLDRSCSAACLPCIACLAQGKRPVTALANGLWLGDVPKELSILTYAEQCLVARVRSNRCVVRVSCGQSKMMANAISFPCPTPKVYKLLPPRKEELDDVLAFIYTGIKPPSEDDIGRTPMLVRRKVVGAALDWLKLNHVDYSDLRIDRAALEELPEHGSPVEVTVRPMLHGTNVNVAATSVHDNTEEEGTDQGDCPFKVNGLIGGNLSTMSIEAKKAAAIRHIQMGGNVLAIGRADAPESIYDNPQLYPQMYPWLFPYGIGGVGSPRLRGLISDFRQKRWMLLYHDKRFQYDSRFILIAFNHEQIKKGTTASFVLAKRRNFASIVTQVASINPSVVMNLSHRLQEGERVIPETEEEKRCYTLMDQIEHVGEAVPGSVAGKKKMRNNLWSMISYKGAPSWFVTLSPVDHKHPLCLYWADKDIKFSPDFKDYNKRIRLIAKNPVAGARFFHFLVQLFIFHLLRWGDKDGRAGVFGHTSAYFGTVEQQGRMTLHLHMLIWIICALSPQEIKDKLMSDDSEFKRDLIAYLERSHTGDFMTGSMSDMKERYDGKRTAADDPTQRLPVAPPQTECRDYTTCSCTNCDGIKKWRVRYDATVDNILYRSNVHKCYMRHDVVTDGVHKEHVTAKGCINKDGLCCARFPRDLYPETLVDEKGHIFMKKNEPMINCVNDTMVYSFGCNTDCGSLSSGTAVNATAGYVADYIVKQGLKTHQIFSSIYDVFERNQAIWEESKSEGDAARRLILKMANSLTSKVEVGGPMAAMYLLGNPDNYTSHRFVPLYWRQYVNDVLRSWDAASSAFDDSQFQGEAMRVDASYSPLAGQSLEDALEDEDDAAEDDDTVAIARSGTEVIARSSVDDYKLRPSELDSVCLYDWIQCSDRRRMSSSKRRTKGYLSYADSHPQKDSFGITYDLRRMDTVIPSIVGPFLPRKDSEDVDYYGCTMLTLFAPWRSGMDLKSSDETWATAFENYTFLERHSAVIRNMNIRYECYDTRDDYHAQMKSRAAALQREMEDDEGELPEFDEYAEEGDDSGMLDGELAGEWSQRKHGQMVEVEGVLHSAGWATDISVHPADPSDAGSFQPEMILPASQWRSVVASERKKFLDSRANAIPGCNELLDDMDVDVRPMNDARIVPGSYLLSTFTTLDDDVNFRLSRIVAEWTLNKEQERVFRIVANHSISIEAAPLRMYVGGMGGTGKTSAIKALLQWFQERGESYRMVVVAPTGSAASIVKGSTWHSFLGVNTNTARKCVNSRSDASLVQARKRLRGVEYLFLDEISMVSCQDLFLIDGRLKDITLVDDTPFGGINVIVAGDFAQLPPAKGQPLYSGEVSRSQLARQVQRDQENTLGMLTWHHFVTVVILKQNMRQRGVSENDHRMRRALEHMRYKDCDYDDIEFLRSRIPEFNPELTLNDDRWRDVSVITAWNTHKDQINEMNAKRFALEHHEELRYFYSIDKQAQATGGQRKRKSTATSTRPIRLTTTVQQALWMSPPYTSEHIPACIPICKGMPIMIRSNEATELCITKGQEAVVHGWTSHEIPGYPDKFALDTLFVELVNPPKTVQLPHLPSNIVPLTKISTSISAVLPNDRRLSISRKQVPVQLNFAMTDYASQGKTRSVNPVDIKHCRNHQAIYTALSRGTSADDTLILRDFNASKLTGGLSGYLRQEFRTLELLDEITTLRYEGVLPPDQVGRLRESTVKAYQAWKSQAKREDVSTCVLGASKKRKASGETEDYIIAENSGKVHKRAKHDQPSEESDGKLYPPVAVGFEPNEVVKGIPMARGSDGIIIALIHSVSLRARYTGGHTTRSSNKVLGPRRYGVPSWTQWYRYIRLGTVDEWVHPNRRSRWG